LYEVIIVLIIILVAATVVAPAFSAFLPSVRVRKAGDELMAAFSKARVDAVLTSRRFRVVFTKDPAAYRIEYEPDPMNEPATFRALPGDWGAKSALPEGVSFTSLDGATQEDSDSEEALEFSPDGTAPEARIVLGHENGESVIISVDPADGRARVVEPEEEEFP
jgi:Tfp pilus assembly protein FimT